LRRIPGSAALGNRALRWAVVSLALTGCLYRFAGGGLPSSIKTVAVLPFDNQTSESTLTPEVDAAVREAVQSRLGLRQGGERQADALVRGTISRYEPDLPVAYTSTGDQREVTVTRRLVQITMAVEIIDQKTGKKLWERSGLVVHGDYESGREVEGRREALDQLVTNIVEGAQSQW
jgi:Lipopolysaccharide-assembly